MQYDECVTPTRRSDSPAQSPDRERIEVKMRLAQYVKFREEKFGGVLFETRSEKVYALNPTAAAIVREITAADCDEPGLIERVRQRYADEAHTLESEISAFVGDLRSQGLLED